MANVKISQLTAQTGDTVPDGALFEIEQATGDSRKVTTAQVQELIRDTMGAALQAGTNVTITPNDPGDKILIAASGGGGGGSGGTAKAPDIAGRLYPIDRYARTNANLAAGNLYIVPFRNPLARSVSGVALRLVSGVAATEVTMGIYADVNGSPSTAGPLASATAPTTASAANAVATFSSPLALAADTFYWFVVGANGAPQVTSIATTDQLLPWYTGYSDVGPGAAYNSISGGYTYGPLPTGAFPALTQKSGTGPLGFLVLA